MPTLRGTLRRAILEQKEGGDREDQGPDATHDHRGAHVQGTLVGHPEETDLGFDEEEEDEQQHDDATEIAHPPPEAGDPTDGPLGGHLVDGRVVVDTRDLGDDRADPEDGQANPQEGWLRLDEEEGGRERGEDPRLDPQIANRASGPVAVLAEHGRQQSHEQPCDRGRDRQRSRRGVGRPETRTGDVDREDEGRDHRVERLGPPVPHPPRQDSLLRGHCVGIQRRGDGCRAGPAVSRHGAHRSDLRAPDIPLRQTSSQRVAHAEPSGAPAGM